MNNGKKLILALICGLPADSKMVQEALQAPGTGIEALETNSIAKEDFLTRPGSDEPLFSHASTWENFSRIVEKLAAQGEQFTARELGSVIPGCVSPLLYAERTQSLPKLFAPEIWKGRLQEADKLFYAATSVERNKLNYPEVRRAIAAQTGEMTPEDRLQGYGLNHNTVRTNIRQGNLAHLTEMLAQHGDHIRKEYVFLLDTAGDNIFEYEDTFKNMDSWLTILENNGERLGRDDFMFKVGNQRTPLDHAVRHGQLPAVFRTRIWKGHADEMMELFNTLPEVERRKVEINKVLGELKEAEYGDRIVTDGTVTLDHLVAVLNEEERDSNPNFFEIRALSFARVWKEMGDIRKTLAARGEKLTLDHLRQPTGMAGDTVLTLAARGGYFNHVMDIVTDGNDRLTLEDLTTPGAMGKTALDILVEREELATLFRPEAWVGRGQDLMTLWEKVPAEKQKTVDFEALYGRVNMLTLRERFAGKPGTPRLGM